MAANATEFLQAIDNADLYAEKLMAALEQKAREDIDYLMSSQEGRDAEFWVSVGVYPETVISDFEKVETDTRDVDWTLGFAGMAAAAATQFFIDNKEETFVKPTAYMEQTVGTIIISNSEIIRAAKRTTDIVTVTTQKFQTLQKKFLQEFAFLNDLSTTEIFGTLNEYGALQPFDHLVADQMGYVSRMTGYQPGSTQFKEEVAKLVDVNAKGVQQKMNRRATERIYSYREADNGDLNALMAWVGEADKRACAYCRERYGEVKTYGEWIDEGMPGAEVCAGGDYCRCHLANVS